MSDPRITDEAVEAGASAIGDLYGHPPGDYRIDTHIALQAALPHLAPQPVVDREAVGNAIEQAASDVDLAKYFLPGTTDHFTDAVLALLNGTAK